jgi:hypothetical protein
MHHMTNNPTIIGNFVSNNPRNMPDTTSRTVLKINVIEVTINSNVY